MPDNVNARLLFGEPASLENILSRDASLRANVERLASIIAGREMDQNEAAGNKGHSVK